MGRRLLASVGVVVLVLLTFVLLCATGTAQAQGSGEPPARSTEMDWTVVEYPEGQEVVVELRPTTLLPDARGTARVTRSSDGATITLDVSGLDGAAGSYHLYAVNHEGRVIPLGVVPTSGGTADKRLAAKIDARTMLTDFGLLITAESDLETQLPSGPVAAFVVR